MNTLLVVLLLTIAITSNVVIFAAPSPKDPCYALLVNGTNIDDNDINFVDDIDDDGTDGGSDVDSDISCEQTEYSEYLKCVESKKEVTRKKRQICPYAQQIKNCKQINYDCRVKCAGDKICEGGCPVCPLNVELLIKDQPQLQQQQQQQQEQQQPLFVPNCQDQFESCYNQCNQISTCEIGCLDQCPNPNGYRTVIIQGGDGASAKYDGKIDAAHNITTIIKLTNIVNNTNVVNVPTNVNTTNINNIHVYANTTDEDSKNGGEFGLGSTDKGSCCFAVRPKTCHTSTNGYRCHHKRHKTCGSQCTARIIHVQSRKRCHKQGGCQNKIAYVPQPQRQRCVYTDRWPHVSCGGDYQQSSCHGCYDHYGYGYDNYHGANNGADGPDCRGCYDDSFDSGPLYRRGPVLRPYYYHQPPCYITGTCYYGNYPMVDCGYGCYGHEMVDPAWGYYPVGGGAAPPLSQRGGDYGDADDYDDDDILYDKDIKNNDTEGSGSSSTSDWAVQIHKCKVVMDDGTFEIRNCTSTDINDNLYAASPSDYPYPYRYPAHQPLPPPNNYGGYRLRRHTKHNNEYNNNYQNPNIQFDDDNWSRNNYNYDEDIDDYDYDRRSMDYGPPPPPRAHLRRNPVSRRQRKPKIIFDDEYDNDEDMEYVD